VTAFKIPAIRGCPRSF